MNSKYQILKEIIKSRRAIYPQFYKNEEISDEILTELIELASWAPNHKMTQPWRFVILKGDALVKLSHFLAEFYKKGTDTDSFSEIKYKKAGEKPLQSSAVIAICINRSPATHIPEWEETAAVACAVQNIWLSMTAMGLVGYWSSPAAIVDFVSEFKIENATECLGFFFLAKPADELPPDLRTRKSVEEISTWLS